MLKKADAFLIAFFLLLTAAVAAWSLRYYAGESGAEVVIEEKGKTVAVYSLYEDREIELEGNVVRIEGGKVFMAEANCPDRYCVRHAPIYRENQQIVCLPNRVVLRVRGEESEVDAYAN